MVASTSFQNPAGNFVTSSDGFAPPAAFGGTTAILHGTFEFTDITPKTLFTLPAGAVPVSWVVDGITDFDAGTNNDIDIGLSSNPDYFIDGMGIGTLGIFLPNDTGAVNGRLGVGVTEPVDVVATYIPTGTASSQGESRFILTYYIGQ